MPAIIGALIAGLLQALRTYLPGIVGRILLAFGIGLTTHAVALPAMKAVIQGFLGRLPTVMYAYFEASGCGIATTMVLSAVIAARSQSVILTKLGSK
ncbi:DUF2523 domain-containing protein [Xanthomonas campestris pv. campestris]|uniref:DUF2523 family protein n=1 Tax=Xanthomonas campestris TaxID=339 RepID=UPI0023780472|nr:DUF2523 family protein [Xanthomonas campestris]WDL15995.1 DUF2523 domain-containing protein [Xanthomonas campestris pv. campestris]